MVPINAAYTSLSGLRAAQRRLDVSAHNVANVATDEFRSERVISSENAFGGTDTHVEDGGGPDGGVSYDQLGIAHVLSNTELSEEFVLQVRAKHEAVANLKAYKAQDEATEAVFDLIA